MYTRKVSINSMAQCKNVVTDNSWNKTNVHKKFLCANKPFSISNTSILMFNGSC